MTADAPTRSAPGTSHGAAWAAAAAMSALVLVSLGYLGPVVPVALLVAAILLLVAAFRPKAFALMAMLVIVFATPVQIVFGSVASYADEGMIALAAVALSARRLVTEGRLVWLPGAGWFAGYLAAGVLSSILADASPRTATTAAFIAVKGVVFAFALAQLRWTRKDLVVLVRLGIAAVVTMAVTGLLNLAVPLAWARLTTGRPPLSYFGPIPALNGIFQHPAAFSRFCGVLAVGCLVYGLVVRRSLANTMLVVVTAGFAFLTVQVKSLVGLLATLTAVGVRFVRPSFVVGLLCVGPLAALILVPPLVDLVGGDIELYVLQDSARSRLTEGGAAVAAQYFPLGAGFGAYGSSTAAQNYSRLYFELGFSERYGLSPDTGHFLNDTQWPAIYGEAGWIGAVCFAAGLACMLVSLLRRTSVDEGALIRWIRISGIGWMILLLVESSAAPVFVSSPSFPFVFAAAGIVASFRSATRNRRTPADQQDDTGQQSGGNRLLPAAGHR
jgi:hypothetical protein